MESEEYRSDESERVRAPLLIPLGRNVTGERRCPLTSRKCRTC